LRPTILAGKRPQLGFSRYAQRKCRDQEENMDYDKMKALMETSRKKSAGQREPEPKEFPRPDSGPDWKYLRERMAA
jgi:hypothetical protein